MFKQEEQGGIAVHVIGKPEVQWIEHKMQEKSESYIQEWEY